MRMKALKTFWLVSMLSLIAPVWASEDPQLAVKQTAEYVLSEVTARKAEFEADPSQIYPLVEQTIVPHFDFEIMTMSAMGRFWRDATSQQQRRVVAEFQEMLVRTYATALLGYTGQAIEYPPVNYAEGSKTVLVPTNVRPNGGPPVPINYRLRLDDQDNWRVYDVVIDGISLVTNYRSTFARQIQTGAVAAKGSRDQRMSAGIDSLIEALSSKNDQPSVPAGDQAAG